MRVNELIIICIRKHDAKSIGESEATFEQPQFEDEARALALRSLVLERAEVVKVIQCSPFMFEGSSPANAKITERIHTISENSISRTAVRSDSPRIGVYVIAEGNTTGIGSLSPTQLVTLLTGYGIRKIDKLSLISCNIGNAFPITENQGLPDTWKDDRLTGAGDKPLTDKDFNNYVARACGILGVRQMGNGQDGKLMVAGWTTYVTVAFPGRTSSALGRTHAKSEKWKTMGWKEGETTPGNWNADKVKKEDLMKMKSGTKYATDISNKKQPANSIAPKPKVFYSWARSTGLRVLQEKDWTDNPGKK
jgi:hypothetical protein